MKLKIKNEELQELNNITNTNFPKYTSQLINWANQNAHGTRPKVVGQLSELFPEYQNNNTDISIDTWKAWYLERYPDSIEEATNKIFTQVENLKEAIKLIDKTMIQSWVEDLVITKTFNGLYVQKAILAKIAKEKNCSFRLATPQEESLGIDGYVGDVPYSIKPDTYKTMNRLSETLNAKMVYYTKKKTSLDIEIED